MKKKMLDNLAYSLKYGKTPLVRTALIFLKKKLQIKNILLLRKHREGNIFFLETSYNSCVEASLDF